MKVLISGAAGRLAHIVADRLTAANTGGPDDIELVGLDLRPQPVGRIFRGHFHRVKRYDHRTVADVFRMHRPDALIHLGIRAATAQSSQQGRYSQNVLGTRHLLELCQRYEVGRVVVLGTYHVYGAHEHNPVNIREDAPLRAVAMYAELVDVVELDHTVTNFMYRHREVNTMLLRAVNIVGPRLHNYMSRLLRHRPCPRLPGFNPLMQFLHEEDAARAIVTALHDDHWGAYNLAGEGAVPYTHAVRLAGGRSVPVPHLQGFPFRKHLVKRFLAFPPHLVTYFRYAVIIDDSAFRTDFGFSPRYSTVETLHWAGTRSS